MSQNRETSFLIQQGFELPPPEKRAALHDALQFQPRSVGAIVLAGTATQSSAIFTALAAALWWGALFPRWNLFDAAHNATFSERTGVRLDAAPAPRRFAQALAGTLAIVIALLLRAGFRRAALVVAAIFLAAVSAQVFRSFCLGSYLYTNAVCPLMQSSAEAQ